MGAWGSGVFENDDACDLLYLLEEDAGLLEATLRSYPTTVEPDASAASTAVAAAALVGAIVSRSPIGDPVADDWLADNSLALPADAVDLALATLAAARDQPNELAELWAEADAIDEWHKTLATIATALGDATTGA